MEKKLAHRFALILNEWIGDHLEEVNRINAERNDNTCATHDYCDANMAMQAAFIQVFQREPVLSVEDDDPAWMQKQANIDSGLTNQAWELAIAAGFDPSKLV